MADGFDPLKDPSFQNASSEDQHAYLSSVDPGYAKASPEDQKAYREHVTTITNPEAMFSQAQQQAAAVPGELPRDPKESILGHQRAVRTGRDEVARETMPLLKTAGTIGTIAGMATPGLDAASIPGMIAPIARTAIGGTIGAIGGERAGSAVGGLAGPTGREVGGTIGSIAGGALGGGMAANMRRLPATFEEATAGQPGRIKPMPMGIQRAIPEWMVPKGRIGSLTNPGPPIDLLRDEMYSDIGGRVLQRGKEENAIATQARRNDPLALAVREGRAAKLPVRMPHINESLTETGKPTGAPPLIPLIGTPEEWNAYDQKMNILRNEAKTAGTYHAARGGAGKPSNLQQRIGKRLSQ